MQIVKIIEAHPEEATLIKELMLQHWGGEPLIIHGQPYYPSLMQGLLLWEAKEIKGFLFYEEREDFCEIMVFEVFTKHKGLGTQMLDHFLLKVQKKGYHKVRVMTTNDNLDAFRFYQRRGFVVTGIHLNALEASRKIKPSIPFTGDYGIPLRDEIMLERNLKA